MQINFLLTTVIAAVVPLLVGFVWYHPKVFGNAWIKSCGLDESKMKEGFNMPLVFGLTLFLGFLISFVLASMVIHQMGFYSMLQAHLEEAAALDFFNQGIKTYGNEFRTFKHGALHGAIAGFGLVLPIIAVNALFERRGFKYIAINAGFWIVSMIIMGGIICQFADMASIG